MSDIEDARRVMREADSLRSKIRDAERVLEALQPPVGLSLAIGRTEISRELRPAVILGVQNQISMWKQEADRLEAKVTVQ